MKKIKKILAKSAWFCHFGWGRVFDGVGKGFTFLVDIFTPVVYSNRIFASLTLVLLGSFDNPVFLKPFNKDLNLPLFLIVPL